MTHFRVATHQLRNSGVGDNSIWLHFSGAPFQKLLHKTPADHFTLKVPTVAESLVRAEQRPTFR